MLNKLVLTQLGTGVARKEASVTVDAGTSAKGVLCACAGQAEAAMQAVAAAASPSFDGGRWARATDSCLNKLDESFGLAAGGRAAAGAGPAEASVAANATPPGTAVPDRCRRKAETGPVTRCWAQGGWLRVSSGSDGFAVNRVAFREPSTAVASCSRSVLCGGLLPSRQREAYALARRPSSSGGAADDAVRS
jgi:hypothetical protein